MKIKVKYHDRDPGFWDKEVEPTMQALADLLGCKVEHMRISIDGAGKLYVAAPMLGHGLLISREDFKKVL